jgi:hypothetical protein
MLLMPLHQLNLARDDTFHHAHRRGCRHEVSLAALWLAEQARKHDEFDHGTILTAGMFRLQHALGAATMAVTMHTFLP